jgi:cell division protein FtsB
VAAAAQARRAAPRPDLDDDYAPRPGRQGARRVSRSRRHTAQRAGLTRVAVIFAVCLTALAVGRVALSFAVVQKSLQTEAVVHESRRVSALNDKRQEEVAQLASTVRIRHIAESELGLVEATHIEYPKPLLRGTVVEVAANR